MTDKYISSIENSKLKALSKVEKAITFEQVRLLSDDYLTDYMRFKSNDFSNFKSFEHYKEICLSKITNYHNRKVSRHIKLCNEFAGMPSINDIRIVIKWCVSVNHGRIAKAKVSIGDKHGQYERSKSGYVVDCSNRNDGEALAIALTKNKWFKGFIYNNLINKQFLKRGSINIKNVNSCFYQPFTGKVTTYDILDLFRLYDYEVVTVESSEMLQVYYIHC